MSAPLGGRKPAVGTQPLHGGAEVEGIWLHSLGPTRAFSSPICRRSSASALNRSCSFRNPSHASQVIFAKNMAVDIGVHNTEHPEDSVNYLEREAREVTVTARLTRRDRELLHVAARAADASLSSYVAEAAMRAARRELLGSDRREDADRQAS